MTWTELRVETTPAAAELVAEFMLEANLRGASITVTDGRAACCAHQPSGSHAQRIAQSLRQRLRHVDPGLTEGRPLELCVREVEDEDWAETWKQHLRPLRVGRRLVVKPSWTEFQAETGDLIIELDPGMAFGTGEHPTTQMCLEALEEAVQPGAVVIDVGTGSAILALAAAKLGAGRVLAIDNDPVAVRVASDNVRRNHATAVVEVRVDNSLDSVVEAADVIVANINSEAVCALAPDASALLARDGVFVSAGMTDASVDPVRRALAQAGLPVIDEARQAEWLCLVARN